MSDPIACKAVRVRIEGRVQGVGFRAWVERTSRGLGLSGWVRNRRDGGVEASFVGPAGSVEAMVARCEIGPRMARVKMVRVLEETEVATHGFEVRATV